MFSIWKIATTQVVLTEPSKNAIATKHFYIRKRNSKKKCWGNESSKFEALLKKNKKIKKQFWPSQQKILKIYKQMQITWYTKEMKLNHWFWQIIWMYFVLMKHCQKRLYWKLQNARSKQVMNASQISVILIATEVLLFIP